MMKIKTAATIIFFGGLSMLAQANDSNEEHKPNASNFRKNTWGVYIQGRKPAPGVFVVLFQEACKYKYRGKLKGVETKEELRKALVFREYENMPGKVIGKGCWSVTLEDHQFEYLGFQGEFNSDKGSGVMIIPWSEIFNFDNAS